ncbi:MAG: malate synthase A, partial [Bacteroidetes bacterium]|nr:malate synthase A [Fibrella sp.]
YAQRLVRVCHRRGIHAIGGMSAYIPNRSDLAVNEKAFQKVTQDKELEAQSGFDGTWVAHPDLVAVARQPFDAVLGDKPHQKDRQFPAQTTTAHDLLTPDVPNAVVTEAGVRQNITIGIQYVAAWLRGSGAVALFNLMEDAATAEISRAQVWQWLHHGAKTDTGRVVEKNWYKELLAEETDKICQAVGEEAYQSGRYPAAVTLFDRMVTQPRFESFLTLAAYEML